VALTRAVQAADFGNIAAALTELDRALAEHAAAGGSWEETGSEGGGGDDKSEEGGGEGEGSRRRRASLLPSGAGEEDVRFLFPFFRLRLLLLPSVLAPISGVLSRRGNNRNTNSHPTKTKNKKT
jgi:hypothetical protein